MSGQVCSVRPRIKYGAGSEHVEGHERNGDAPAVCPLIWFDRLTTNGQGGHARDIRLTATLFPLWMPACAGMTKPGRAPRVAICRSRSNMEWW